MQGIRTFWNKGTINKVILIAAGGGVVLSLCCVALVVVGLLIPAPKTVSQPTTGGAVVALATVALTSVPTQIPTLVPTESPPTIVPEPTQEPTPSAVPSPIPTNTPEPTSTPLPPTPLPTDTPQPTAVPLPADVARVAVEGSLDRSNRNVERVVSVVVNPDEQTPRVFVRWSINDNLTEGLIKSGAQLDASKILKAVAQSGIAYSDILIEGTFPLTDRFGNTKETVVVHALYSHATIDKINWENFSFKNVYAIADEVTIHPAFQQ